MVINVSTGSDRQRVTFSDGTYLEFQIVGDEVVVLSTNNKYIADIYGNGNAFHIDLNGDTIQIGSDMLKFNA